MEGVTSEIKEIGQDEKGGSSRSVSHRCEICDRQFMTRLVLFRHMFVHVGKLNKKKTGFPYYPGNQACKSSLQKAKKYRKRKVIYQKSVAEPTVCRQTEEFSNTVPSVNICSDDQDGKISPQMSKNNSPKCEICSQQFVNELSLFQHSFTHTGELSGESSSSKNNKLASETPDLCLHSTENHQDCETSSQKPKETSEKCESLEFANELSLFEHASMHAGELSIVTQDLYHHSDKPSQGYTSGESKLNENSQKCEICGRKYVTKLSLFRHMFTHTGTNSNRIPNVCRHASENPEDCKICLQKPSQNLLDFRRGTDTEELYSCSVCTKKFTFRTNFLKHVCFSSRERLHQCEICLKRFSGQGRFFRHLRTHTGELPYECDMCCKKYNNKSNLVQHLKVHATENSN